MQNYYFVLGVDSDASFEEIRAAFRRRAMELHPDRSGLESQPFLDLQEAYGVLGDRERRQAYDRQLSPAETLHRTARAAESMVSRRAAESFRPPSGPSAPAQPHDFRWAESFENYRPSFDELFDRLWSNFLPVPRPKGEHVQPLTVEVVLTPRDALAGGQVLVYLPTRERCAACGGAGQVEAYLCWRCAGRGSSIGEHAVEVHYPAGVRDGYGVQIPLIELGIDNFFLTVIFRVAGVSHA
jgi:molecular chaperone DnaJ